MFEGLDLYLDTVKCLDEVGYQKNDSFKEYLLSCSLLTKPNTNFRKNGSCEYF